MDNSLETEEQRLKLINDELDRRIRQYHNNLGGRYVTTYNGGVVSTEFVPHKLSNRGRDD